MGEEDCDHAIMALSRFMFTWGTCIHDNDNGSVPCASDNWLAATMRPRKKKTTGPRSFHPCGSRAVIGGGQGVCSTKTWLHETVPLQLEVEIGNQHHKFSVTATSQLVLFGDDKISHRASMSAHVCSQTDHEFRIFRTQLGDVEVVQGGNRISRRSIGVRRHLVQSPVQDVLQQQCWTHVQRQKYARLFHAEKKFGKHVVASLCTSPFLCWSLNWMIFLSGFLLCPPLC